MSSRRAQSMGGRTGFPGMIDRLRYHELSRQLIGLILVLLCAWFATPGPGRVGLGLLISGAGQLWRVYAAGAIAKNHKLATTGAYSVVRHPLYLGNLLILGGFALACARPGMVALVIGFIVFYYPAAVRYEDAKLERIFGADWRAWKQNTPALFPSHLHWRCNEGEPWNARQSLLRNGELPVTMFLLACAWLLVHRLGIY